VALRISKPDEVTNRTEGIFFALIKVDNIPSLVPWTDQLLQYAEQTYSQNIKLDPTASVERALGVVRQKLRLKLQQIVQETRTISLSDVHYCLGVLKGKNLTLTHQGTARAMLLHQRTIPGQEQAHIHWINLTEVPLSKAAARKMDEPTAPSVVSGTIGPNDTILVATESLFDALSLGKIEQMISLSVLDGAEKLLEKSLQRASTRFNLAILLLRLAGPNSLRPSQEKVTQSMATLVSQEADTRSLLVAKGPTPLKSTLKFISNFWQRPRSAGRPGQSQPNKIDRPLTQTAPASNQPKEEQFGQWLGVAARYISSLAGQFAIWLMVAPVRLLVNITSPEGRGQVAKSWRHGLQNLAEKIAGKIQAWPRSTQKLLIISLFLAYLFTQSLVFLADKNRRDQLSAGTAAQAQEIQNKLDQAESNMIYGNDESASQLMAEARLLFQALPNKTATEKQRWQLLNDKITNLQRRAAHEILVSSPTVVVDLTNTEIGSVDGLIFQDSKLTAYKQDGSKLATVNLKTNEVKHLATSQSLSLRAGTTLTNDLGIFLSTTGLVQVNTTSGQVTQMTSSGTLPQAVASTAYNGRLYLLSPTDRQVWRFLVTDNSLGQASPWIKGSSPEITTASGVAIDGEVYVLATSGSVYKFANGNKTDWQAARVEAAAASRLIASADHNFIFALDGSTKKVIVWNKTDGKLIGQFTLPFLDKLVDLAVSGDGKTVYVTDGQKIYKFEPATQS
jgi:hypothetical protein